MSDLLAMTPERLSARLAARGHVVDGDPIVRADIQEQASIRSKFLAVIKKEYPGARGQGRALPLSPGTAAATRCWLAVLMPRLAHPHPLFSAAAGMRITSLEVWETKDDHVVLPDPPPGHWRWVCGHPGEGAPPEAQGAAVLRERSTGVQVGASLAGSALVLKPGRCEDGELRDVCLFPHTLYLVAGMVPKDASRACSFCATAGVRLQKCGACKAVRYWCAGVCALPRRCSSCCGARDAAQAACSLACARRESLPAH